MKKIAIALTALIGIAMLSGCAYEYPNRVAYGYGYYPYHHYYFLGGIRRDCFYDYDVAFCG